MEITNENFNDHVHKKIDGSKIIFKDKNERDKYEYGIRELELFYGHMKDFPQHSIDQVDFCKDKEELEDKFKDLFNDFLKKYPDHAIFYELLGKDKKHVFPFWEENARCAFDRTLLM